MGARFAAALFKRKMTQGKNAAYDLFAPSESEIHVEVGFNELNNPEFVDVVIAWFFA